MLTINFHPFQNLETERLLLRRLNPNDVAEVFAMRSNPEVMQYIPRPLAQTKEDALPEREQAGETEQQIAAHGCQRKDEHLAGQRTRLHQQGHCGHHHRSKNEMCVLIYLYQCLFIAIKMFTDFLHPDSLAHQVYKTVFIQGKYV